MRTRLSPDNPHGPTRHGFAWEHVPAGGEAHLDVGCYDGAFLASLRAKGVRRLAGVDAATDAVARAHERFADLDVRHVAEGAALPFEAGAFTSVTLLDVLEHVHDQEALLGELARVLREDGRLIVTVPRQYVFSCLDAGNLKFRFPRLHRWFYRLAHSRMEYERRYAANPDGLVGDVSARKRWHEHFSQERLAAVLQRGGFEPVAWDASGSFARPLFPLLAVLGAVSGLRGVGRALAAIDARLFGSMNLFCVAQKKRRGAT